MRSKNQGISCLALILVAIFGFFSFKRQHQIDEQIVVFKRKNFQLLYEGKFNTHEEEEISSARGGVSRAVRSYVVRISN